jgi:hypothetical protein
MSRILTHREITPRRPDCLAAQRGFELLNPETRGKRWGDWRLILIAERSGLPRRRECHCRRAEVRAGWPDPGSCPAGDGATAGLRRWRRLVPSQPKRILKCRTAKSPLRPSLRAPRAARTQLRSLRTFPWVRTRGGTKQEAVLARFWREGERTEFEVLNGNASLVERCEMGVKAAQLRDRTEPV